MSTKLPQQLALLSKSQLESLCVDCGACCHAAVPIAKGVTALIPELHCKHMTRAADGKTGCAVYSERLTVAKGWCNCLEDAITKGLFPDACPYVSGLPGYEGPVVLADSTYELVRPQIKKAIIEKGMPPWVAEDQWSTFTGED